MPRRPRGASKQDTAAATVIFLDPPERTREERGGGKESQLMNEEAAAAENAPLGRGFHELWPHRCRNPIRAKGGGRRSTCMSCRSLLGRACNTHRARSLLVSLAFSGGFISQRSLSKEDSPMASRGAACLLAAFENSGIATRPSLLLFPRES